MVWDNFDPRLNLRMSANDREMILSFASDNYKNTMLFKPNGQGRQYCTLNKFDIDASKLARNLNKHFFDMLGFTNTLEEPMFGNFIGVNGHGGSVHEHIDKGDIINGVMYEHIRINFLISKPFFGGMPIIDKKITEIQENESWINIASRWRHSSTPVEGNKLRVVLSLGALVETKQIVDKFYG